jgi:hypothetical protein
VAHFAGGREAGGAVVERPGVIEVPLVAGDAIGAQPGEDRGGRAAMAGFAVHCRVRAQQRKAVEVVPNRLYGNVPAANRMALLAVGAELPPVNVGVAVRASRTDVREHQLGMALHALDLLVHPAEGITGFIVAKFRNAAYGLPTDGGVAVFARNIDRAVGVACTG